MSSLHNIGNRPGVAGAILQTPLSLIKWLTELYFAKKENSLQVFEKRRIPPNFRGCSSIT